MTGQEQALFLCLARWKYAGYMRDYLESVKLRAGGVALPLDNPSPQG